MVHPINAPLLAQGEGKYRCGKCGKMGNALEALFDQWPDASQKATEPGDLPELGVPLTLDEPADPDITPEEAALLEDSEDEPEDPKRNPLIRPLWITAAVVFIIVITLNVASVLEIPLLDDPRVDSKLIEMGLKEAPPEPPFRDVEKIELLSREMKAHPSRPGVLLLTATMVNRADRSQAYPEIDVTLLDIRSRILARKLFRPGDYLSRTSELRTGMTPDAYLTFSLELLDPGDQATGFEFQFQ